ncbi:DUF6531 domain-containing protein [Kutzneria kofuensis]|uniref:RHS repeat-associated protein n=1 Tax=Kutzneria kofuensis TaxID=103725 RepID=A0A7W9NG08_9PSEU|nr:DUF6531 domain-containing protein [Kutzneria kofuensis]MBB5890603.1 RHS repeat-associated protein [Kutzneria kofuensis]
MSKVSVHPDHLRSSGGTLSEFGGKLAEGGQKLETAGQSLVSHASGDRSGIGAVVAKLFGRGVQITGKVFSEGGRVVEGAGKRLHTTANLYEEADHNGAGLLKKLLHPGAKGDIDPHGGGARQSTRVGAGGGRRGGRTARAHVGDNPRAHAVQDSGRTKTKDPVDLATGEVLLTQTDLELPGILPLVLSRTHLSSYRVGRCFGSTWASTLDQRLEIDEQGAVFIAADGVLLVYPSPPADGSATWALEGPRWPLHRTGGGYVITQPESGQSLHFTDAGVLVAVTDRAGNRIDISHDTNGAPAQITHSGGYRLTVDTLDGVITAFHMADATIARFGYDDQHHLVEVVNASGLPLRFAYDTDGRLTEWVDRNGMSYRYHYDNAGRCTATEGAGGQLNAHLEFDRENLITTATDSLGHVTRYHLNDAQQVVMTADPLGGQTISEWDRYDRLLSRTDPLGHTTRYEYSDAGDLVRVTRPDGTQTVAEYNDMHLPLTFVDADGAVWRREYDTVGNLVAVTDPAGAVTHYGYDDQHRLVSMTDPLGATTHIECNSAGLPVSVTDPIGATIRYEHNDFGQVTAIIDPAGAIIRLDWSTDGNLLTRTHPDGATERWDYDGEGNEIAYTDALGQVTRTEYAGFDLPVAETDPTGARIEFSYDTELRLISLTNPAGLVWRYEYDPAGNLVTETDFNGRTLTYRHDAAGRLIARINALGQITVYTHDPLGRVLQRQAVDGIASFSYDSAGRLVRATTPDSDLVLARDSCGRVTSETCNGLSVTTSFDSLGRRVRRVTPSGAVSDWSYDAAGQPLALGWHGHELEFGYDRAGREVSRRFGTVSLIQTWDASSRLHTQALTVPDLTRRQQRLLQRRAYTYRSDGAITNVVDQLAGVRSFTLDPLGRATAVTTPDHTEQYGYDLSGNIADPTRSHTGTLTRIAGASRAEYDAQGRVTARHTRTLSGQVHTWRYMWNSEDRLIAATTPDGTEWRYLYDAIGRRVAKRRLASDGSIAEQTVFAWDGLTLAEQSHSSGHITTWDYQPGTFTPVTQSDRVGPRDAPQEWIDQRFYAIVTDTIGTPTELVDANGDLAWRQVTTLWGAPLSAIGQRGYCPLRFPGQYYDPETGLHYNHFRYYNPDDGTYATSDPLGLDGGPNPHGYVPNPTGWLDPLGLAPCRVKQLKRDLGRAGMSVRKYDLVHVPEILDEYGRPIYGRSRADGAGNPVLGPRGRPLIEITDLGLASRNEAVATVFHEAYHIESFKRHGHGGTEDAAEAYGQKMLAKFLRRTRGR